MVGASAVCQILFLFVSGRILIIVWSSHAPRRSTSHILGPHRRRFRQTLREQLFPRLQERSPTSTSHAMPMLAPVAERAVPEPDTKQT